MARIEEAVGAALDELETMRVREGTYLRTDLDARRARLGELFEQVARAAEAGIGGLQARLAERVRELRADALADEAAIAQEIARFVGRSDITEEVVRFRGHLDHWQALSDGPEPCGRKLDFLLQEMNREVNTAGSKAEGPAVSELIVSFKASSRRCGSRFRMSSDAPLRRGLLFVVSAPSGTGKTTVVERLVQVTPDLALSRSYTSRGIRAGEHDGIDYNFISRAGFEAMIARGRVPRMGRRLRQPLRDQRRRRGARAGGGPRPGARHRRPGRPPGAAALRGHGRHLRPPAIVRCSRAAAARAQQGFGRGDAAAPATARNEVAAVLEYDYVVVNDELDACVERMRAVVLAERARLRCMRGVSERIIGTFRAGPASEEEESAPSGSIYERKESQ